MNSVTHHSHCLDTEPRQSMLKKPVHMMWQGQMTWRLPKSTQTSRWKTVWESERQERVSEEGVCAEGETQHIRNRAKGKVIETFWEEEAEKASALAHNDATPLVLGCTVGKNWEWVPLHSQNVQVNMRVHMWAMYVCVCALYNCIYNWSKSPPHFSFQSSDQGASMLI